MSGRTCWMAVAFLSVVAIALDVVTGPYTLFPIAFVPPVCLAAWRLGPGTGTGTALALSAVRFALAFDLPDEDTWAALVNAAIRGAVLCALAVLTATVARQRRARTKQGLAGVLPICSFCKKIRCADGHWEPIEAYVAVRTGVKFSHGFCDPCGRQRYPQLYDPETGQMV